MSQKHAWQGEKINMSTLVFLTQGYMSIIHIKTKDGSQMLVGGFFSNVKDWVS